MSSYTPSVSQTGSLSQRQNRVLRNTYALLAVSMIPTVLGAAVGMASGIGQAMLGSPGLSAIVFLAGAFGFMFAIERNKDRGLGVALLLAFTFFMGIMLSRLVGFVLGMQNGGQLIMTAFGGTAAVFASMAMLAGTIKKDLSQLGRFLFVGAIMLLVVGIANIFLQMPALTLTLSVLAIGIFSAFILVDLQRVIRGGENNYIVATLGIYLSVYNVFSSLLVLLGLTNDD